MSYFGKRALDLALAAPAFAVTLPVQIVAATAIRLCMGRPVFFCQERPGLHGASFTLVKFRTMLEPDASGKRIDDASRLTGLGRLMRSSSVDELPTLWNVLKGDMSLVGPRPLLTQYLDVYTPAQARRHQVRPGLTGLAQINGRNELSWEERFDYDLAYVRDHSLIGDLRIMVATLILVIKREGISAPGEATMPVFRGTNIQRRS